MHSAGAALDDRGAVACLVHGDDSQPGCPGQILVLIERALAAAGQHQHAQVHLGERRVGGVAMSFDDQHPAMLVCRLGAAAQDRGGVVVVPVMDDLAEQVGVRAGGQRVEGSRALGPCKSLLPPGLP